MLSVDEIRGLFPAIRACPDALLDNAGGSQVPRQVADAMRDYMLTNYVQLGADYDTSRRSTETVERAHEFWLKSTRGPAGIVEEEGDEEESGSPATKL